MRQFQKPDRNQILLMAFVNLESVAPIGSAVRSIDTLVDALDTSKLEKEYALESPTGRNPFHPKTIIKVCLFAMHSCRFSLRKMESDTGLNLAYRWLTGNKTIDHSTLGKFLIKYRDDVVELFTQTVLIAKAEGLIDFAVLAIDSVKLRANASYKQDRTIAGLDKEETRIKEQIKIYLDSVQKEEFNDLELKVLEAREEKLKTARKVLQARIEVKSQGKTENEIKKIKENTRINLTDNDPQKMKQANGEINMHYSTTTCVDTKADIITHFQINEGDNDDLALDPAIAGSEQKSGRAHDAVDADSNFSSFTNLEKLQADKQSALIPDKRFDSDERNEHARGDYDRSHFKYNADKDVYVCPTGQTLEKESTFQQNGRTKYQYGNANACQNCPFKIECTTGVKRTITRDANEKIKEDMRQELAKDENKELYKLRAHAAESPFGNIKHNLKYRILLRRGRDRVKIEIGLLCILHNILKIARYASTAMS